MMSICNIYLVLCLGVILCVMCLPFAIKMSHLWIAFCQDVTSLGRVVCVCVCVCVFVQFTGCMFVCNVCTIRYQDASSLDSLLSRCHIFGQTGVCVCVCVCV